MTNRIKSSDVQLGNSYLLECKREQIFTLPDKPDKDKKDNRKKQEEEQKLQKQREEQLQLELSQRLSAAAAQAQDIIEDAQAKAAEIAAKADASAAKTIAKAEAQAAEVIAKTEQDAINRANDAEVLKQQSIENGYAEGFQKGYEEGLAKAKEEADEKVHGLDELGTSLLAARNEVVAAAEREMLDLTVCIAEKILRCQLEIKPELIKEIIKAAIAQLPDKKELKIIVNPGLLGALSDFDGELKEMIKNLKSIRIIEDRTIPEDGVIVESPESRIDGRIEAQIREIVKNIVKISAET